MKWIICDNHKEGGKYWRGRYCHEEMLVDDNARGGICWKCVMVMVPVEPPKVKSGYPRGWKFMSEFVDTDGNVFHKGVAQPDLFGKRPATEIKKTSSPKKSHKKEDSLQEKIDAEVLKRLHKKSTKKTTPVEISSSSIDKFFGTTDEKKSENTKKTIKRGSKSSGKKNPSKTGKTAGDNKVSTKKTKTKKKGK